MTLPIFIQTSLLYGCSCRFSAVRRGVGFTIYEHCTEPHGRSDIETAPHRVHQCQNRLSKQTGYLLARLT